MHWFKFSYVLTQSNEPNQRNWICMIVWEHDFQLSITIIYSLQHVNEVKFVLQPQVQPETKTKKKKCIRFTTWIMIYNWPAHTSKSFLHVLANVQTLPIAEFSRAINKRNTIQSNFPQFFWKFIWLDMVLPYKLYVLSFPPLPTETIHFKWHIHHNKGLST